MSWWLAGARVWLLRFVMALSVALAPVLFACGVAAASPATFVGRPLPPAPGLGLAQNHDGEPALAASPDGDFWAAAFVIDDPRVAPAPLFTSAQDVWRSSDGGQTYRWVAAPFNVLRGQASLAGGDENVAVATERNPAGHFNVYTASLWVLAATPNAVVGDIALAVSQDDGRTWLLDPLAATVPLDDRPWLAADGACTLYLSYHALPTFATVVNRYDLCDPLQTVAGLTTTPLASTRYVQLAPSLVTQQPATYVLAGFGRPVADTSPTSRFRHRVYIPAMDCGDLAPALEIDRAVNASSDCPGTAQVLMQISADGGKSWSIHHVAPGATVRVPLDSVSAATDAVGAVYLSWFQDHDAFLDVSHDGGVTWSAPVRVNPPTLPTVAFPRIAAGAPGHVDIAWYGTSRPGAAGDVRAMGNPNAAGAATWRVYSSSSTDGGRTFTTSPASGVVHTGAVCTSGDACVTHNGRTLFEDFGIAISPATGRASIVYTSDQPQGDYAHDYIAYATEQPAAPERGRPTLKLLVTPRHVRAGRRTMFHFRTLTTTTGVGRRAQPGVTIRFAGKHARSDRHGRATIVKRLRRPGTYRAQARKAKLRATALVHVRRR